MSDSSDIPTFEQLAADPEIAALLAFEPVAVRPRVNGWDAAAQRAFIALLAITGSKTRAAAGVGRAPPSIDRLMKRSTELRAAHDAAMALFRRKHGQKLAHSVAAASRADPNVQASGQVMNELGEWEDEQSMRARADDARDSITMKLLNARRLYLAEISGSPGKRAAFEILTELPVDWELASKLKPQPDEPWRRVNMREPDMLLTAENGWLNDCAHGIGPDKMADLRAALDRHRAEQGLKPISWDGDEDSLSPPRERAG